ncbi:hypothetical protein O6H91_12G004800 [Diphasiastrum complanatum]|nr:hypothetical protein O6H91_12G004800 [Diphasiastrum complanatum]
MVTVTYIISKDFEVRTEMEAVAETKATPVSLAQHTYWNLCGHNSGDILNHWLRIWASQITPVNDHQIPVGLLTPVHNTPFDFTEEAQIGSRIDKVPGGYDHNYVLDGELREQGLHLAARARDRSSGRVLELLTNAPGMQFYTGNFLDEVLGKGGYVYRKHAGFCLETQGFPNAINQPNFPSIFILPGQTYKHVMIYRFSFEEDRSNDAPPLS